MRRSTNGGTWGHLIQNHVLLFFTAGQKAADLAMENLGCQSGRRWGKASVISDNAAHVYYAGQYEIGQGILRLILDNKVN